METEQRVNRAKEVVKGLIRLYSKPHPRIHSETGEDNVNRLRALEGLCGDCVNLRLRFKEKHGKNIVALLCEEGYSPLTLYENTPLGEEASCKGFDRTGKQ